MRLFDSGSIVTPDSLQHPDCGKTHELLHCCRLDDSQWRSLFEPTSSAPAASRSGDQRCGSSSALHSPGPPTRQPAASRSWSRSRSRSRSAAFHSNRSRSSGRSPAAAPSNARSHSHGSGHTRSAGRSVQSGRQQAERSPSHGPCEEEQNASDHTHSHGRRHSGRRHGRCGRRRRHLRDTLRPRGFLGAWRPLRRRRRSHSASADAIAAAVASGPARVLDLSLSGRLHAPISCLSQGLTGHLSSIVVRDMHA